MVRGRRNYSVSTYPLWSKTSPSARFRPRRSGHSCRQPTHTTQRVVNISNPHKKDHRTPENGVDGNPRYLLSGLEQSLEIGFERAAEQSLDRFGVRFLK